MAKNPFQQLDVIRKASQEGKPITDCYRLMYKRDLWIKAFVNLYPISRNRTIEIGEESIDRYRLQTIDAIISELKAGTFRFAPVRGSAIPKADDKKISIGVPVCKDKLVQEVMRMILENVFDPTFSNNSHGFREGKNCHTALSQIKNTWKGLTWCFQGDLNGFFDHSVLLMLISRKVKDNRFLLLVHNALSSGVLENWTYQKRASWTRQGGIISPLLANIYLNEFDCYMEKLIKGLNIGKSRARNKDNEKICLNITSLKYVRYATDFVVGIAGSKKSAMITLETIKNYLKEGLHLDLSINKTDITHMEKPIPFLGYEFSRWDRMKVTSGSCRKQKHSLQKRTLIGEIKLAIPERKLKAFALTYGYGNLDSFKIIHRAKLINNSELKIINTYNNELRKIAHFYRLANNYHHLDRLFYLAESSFIKTIAHKRRSTSMKVALSMRTHKQGVLCLVKKDTNGYEQLHQFVKLKDLPKHKSQPLK